MYSIRFEKTMELIWKKVRQAKPDYIVEMKQNYGGSKLATYGTMMRAGDTPYCPEGNFLRTAYIQSYTPYAANDYQTITNYDTMESAAKIIIKMLAVGIPTYSMNLAELDQEKKDLIRFLNYWYIENIVEKENFKRTAMGGMLSVWRAGNAQEDLYFAINGAKEVVVEGKDFQLLNASMYPEIIVRAEADAKDHLAFYDHTGKLIGEENDVCLKDSIRVAQPAMLIKATCMK